MGAEAARWAWKQGIGDREQERILVCLARLADDDTGHTEVQVAKIAALCEVSTTRVRTALAEFVRRGLIEKSRSGHGTRYIVKFERFDRESDKDRQGWVK